MQGKIFLCGGAIRDILDDKKPKDMDYVILVSSYEEMKNYILANGGTIFQERPEFQIIRGSLPNIGAADFALPRKDGKYSDNRRPDNTEIASTLYEDSLRRDFTVNAMYKNVETGEIIDYHGGKEDLEKRLLKTVGLSYDRFEEDPLRMLRAIRFAITKGFYLSNDIISSLHSRNLIDLYKDSVSIERSYEELKKCFAVNTLETLRMIGVYKTLFNEILGNEPFKIRLNPVINAE